MTSGINRPIKAAATISAALTVPSTRPAKAAAATAPSASRTRSHAGTSAAFSAPSRQQPSHDIDQLKRHQKRIGDRARAEQRRDHGIARESEQPRGQRSGGYGEEGTDHEGFYISVACWRGVDRDRPQHLRSTGLDRIFRAIAIAATGLIE